MLQGPACPTTATFACTCTAKVAIVLAFWYACMSNRLSMCILVRMKIKADSMLLSCTNSELIRLRCTTSMTGMWQFRSVSLWCLHWQWAMPCPRLAELYQPMRRTVETECCRLQVQHCPHRLGEYRAMWSLWMKEHNAHWQWFTSNAILEWTKAVIFVVLTAFTIPQYNHYDGAWDLPITWLCTKWIQHGKQAVPRKDCGNTQQKQGIFSKCELYCVEKVLELFRGYAHEGGKLLEICTRNCCHAVQMRRTLSPAVSFHRLFASVPRFVHSAFQAVVHKHCFFACSRHGLGTSC